MDVLVNLPPIALGAIIFGIVLLMALIRHMETKHLSDKYPPDKLLLVSFGVTYFGMESKISKPRRTPGAIALVEDGVYFHSRFGHLEVFIPKNKIQLIGTTDFFCDKPLNDTVVQISFRDDEGNLDRTAFRIPAPAKWIMMLKKQLLGQ